MGLHTAVNLQVEMVGPNSDWRSDDSYGLTSPVAAHNSECMWTLSAALLFQNIGFNAVCFVGELN